ncbi:MAG: hypothetical protein WCG85_03815 [Polyangia bacterium]
MARQVVSLTHVLFFFVVGSAGCGSLVKVDVDCKKLCLANPGPTIPALSSVLPYPVDGAIPSSDGDNWDGGFAGPLDSSLAGNSPTIPTLEWIAEIDFNSVLAQLPSAAAGLSADVRLASVTLASTTSLDFVDSIEVSMSHGTASASGSASSDEESVDGGTGPACRQAGPSVRVAYYQRIESSIAGPTIALIMVNPDLNMFDCMKDEPTNLDVKLTSRPGSAPANDAPLTLGTCIGAETHASYP